jgi:alpha-glucosidase
MVDKNWGKRIIYQIYPRSFKDSGNDGIGDLKGIGDKLGYLKSLGIDAIWLSPIYRSPMRDFGYDISDYYDIDPIFGTSEDFDNLIKKSHDLDIKVLMDFVPNHTSIDHSWFMDSKSDKKSQKRDWYIWRPPGKKGGVPNNWLSQFGGSAWEFDKTTGEYYLHTFDVSQPDLNWRNQEVVEQILNVMRYWLDRGVDGFRVDVAYYLFKDPFFRDEPANPAHQGHRLHYDSLSHIYTIALPETLEMIKRLNNVVNEYEDRFMVCEIYTFLHEIVNLYNIIDHQSFAPFNFSLISHAWDAREQKKFIDEFDKLVGQDYFPTYVLGNHDQPRIYTRLGEAGARAAAMLQLTLRGIPFIYYGEELGMKNVNIPKEKIRDPMVKKPRVYNFGRDTVRTPMQWNGSKFGGFSKVEPWLPLEKGFTKKNVDLQENDKKSFLNLYKTLIRLRKTRESLSNGKYIPLDIKNENIMGFVRQKSREKTLILINFSKTFQEIQTPRGEWKEILNTNMNKNNRSGTGVITLQPSEGIIFRQKDDLK